jgi:hypothetical protein
MRSSGRALEEQPLHLDRRPCRPHERPWLTWEAATNSVEALWFEKPSQDIRWTYYPRTSRPHDGGSADVNYIPSATGTFAVQLRRAPVPGQVAACEV